MAGIGEAGTMDYRAGLILAAVGSGKPMTLADLLNYYDWLTWDELGWDVIRDCGDTLLQVGLIEVANGRMTATAAGQELLAQFANREDPEDLGRAIWEMPKVNVGASLPFTELDVRRARKANKVSGMKLWLLVFGVAAALTAVVVWMFDRR